MPNEYSVEIHDFISQEISEINRQLEHHVNQDQYLKGRLTELLWLRDYLGEHIDLKNFNYY